MSNDSAKSIHAFISHSSQDAEWARLVCDSLEKRRLKCWVAPRDITPGSEWGEAIIDGIDQSRLVILIFSNNANESPQVRREIERAIGKTIPVLPVRIEDIRPRGALEFALSNTHWLDAFASPVEDRLKQLGEAVESLLGIKRATKPPSSDPTIDTRPVSHPGKTESAGTAGHAKHRLLKPLVILGAMVAIIGLSVPVVNSFLSTSSTSSSDVAEEPESKDRLLDKDNTLELQGFWKVVAESHARGVFSADAVAARNQSLAIREHSVVHRWHTNQNTPVVVNGTIELGLEGDTQVFSMRGKDQDHTGCVWKGIYRYKDDILELCYRESKGTQGKPVRLRDLPKQPESMLTSGERGTNYLKLERSVRKPKGRASGS